MTTEPKRLVLLCALLYTALFGLLLSPGSALRQVSATEGAVTCDLLCGRVNGFLNGMAAYCPDTLAGLIKTTDRVFPVASSYLEPWLGLSANGARLFKYRPPPKPLLCSAALRLGRE